MRRSRNVLVLAVTALAAAAFVAGSAGASHPQTTGVPGTFATINVRITDTQLILDKHGSTGVQVIGFHIRNVGKKAHNFIIGDYATNAIRPGQFDDFAVRFADFGRYLYRCTLKCLHSQRGYINVKRGNFNGTD